MGAYCYATVFGTYVKGRLTDVSDFFGYLDINAIVYQPKGDLSNMLRSHAILDMAFDCGMLDSRWKKIISRIHAYMGVGNTVWGIKNERGRVFLECYFYYPYVYPAHTIEVVKEIINPFTGMEFFQNDSVGRYQCLSIDIAGEFIPGINVYRLDAHENNRISASSWFLSPRGGQLIPMNRYYSLLSEPGFYEDGFHFADSAAQIELSCKTLFPETNPRLFDIWRDMDYLRTSEGSHWPVGVAEKKQALGIYFMRLSVSEFIGFLKYHAYPQGFVERVEENKDRLSHIRYDIGVDYSAKGGSVEIVKTAFFGSM